MPGGFLQMALGRQLKPKTWKEIKLVINFLNTKKAIIHAVKSL